MSEDDTEDSQKTEEPSQKKLEEARKRGQVPLSREINNWLMLFVATLLIATLAPSFLADLTDILKEYIAKAHEIPSAPGGLNFALGAVFIEVAKLMVLPFLALMAVAFLGPFLQVGMLFAPELIKPDWSKISPVKGFSRLFSMRSMMEFFKGLLKLCVISLVGVLILYPFFGQLEHTIGLPLPVILDELKTLIIRLMIGVLVVLMVIAVIDLIYQRHTHYKKMRMTKQEVKDEYKQTEGDPHIKARLRQLRTERARRRMMQAVPEADVVITNPTHFSIALKYDPDVMEAPVCIAKGIDQVAQRIREVAKEHNIVIFENPPLARALYETVDLDETVPTEHYKAVAEVITYVFKLRGKLRK
ncbi:MAG: flagellar biosynthesis protein FlhB [Alphaproteobacteria bacterium]